jgi:protein required for attachment to host cells
LVQEFEHPEGRKLNIDIDSDRAGRVGEGAGAQHTADRHQSAAEHVSEVFAKRIARDLRDARNDNRFARLVLVAEPGFLGLLSAALDGPTADTVIGRVTKDLATTPARELGDHLSEVLRV